MSAILDFSTLFARQFLADLWRNPSKIDITGWLWHFLVCVFLPNWLLLTIWHVVDDVDLLFDIWRKDATKLVHNTQLLASSSFFHRTEKQASGLKSPSYTQTTTKTIALSPQLGGMARAKNHKIVTGTDSATLRNFSAHLHSKLAANWKLKIHAGLFRSSMRYNTPTIVGTELKISSHAVK